MVTITPPPVAPTSGPTPGLAPVITIPTPPPVLTQLPTGLIFDAQLVKPDGAPPQLQTPFGPVTARLPFPLPPASLLQVEVNQLTPQLQLRIIALDGQSFPQPGSPNTQQPGQYLGQSSTQQLSSGKPSTSASTGGIAGSNLATPGIQSSLSQPVTGPTTVPTSSVPTVSVDIGANLTGVVLRSPINAASSPPPAGAPSSPPTAEPLTPGSSSNSGTPVSSSAEKQPTASANHRQSGLRAAALLTEGAQLSAKIVPSGATSEGQPSSNAAAVRQIISAPVVASTPAGQSVINLQGSLVALNTTQPIASGEVLNLEIDRVTPPPSGKVAINQLVSHVFHHREWPLLNSSMTELQEAAPATSHQLLNTVVPRANAQLTTNILLFLNLLGGGNFRGWLGNVASRLMDAERPGLMNQLDDEFSRLSRSYNETSGSEWRTAFLPFFTGSELEQVRFHTKGQRDEDGENEDEPKRFLIDIELSELGRIQLDGLVRGKNKRFDLFFRTDQPAPPEMRREINRIFVDFVEASGVKGSIIFQANGEFVDVPSPTNEASVPYGWTV